MKFTPLKWLCMMHSKILCLVGALLVLSSCGCSKKRTLPDVDPVAMPRYNTGLSVNSNLLNRVVNYDILLPEGYNEETERRYPVMYCFHGYGDDNTSWNGKWMACEAKIKQLESQGLEPMIYVFPNGWNTYWVDRSDGTYPYMTMLAEEFIPFIDRTYRTLPDREHRGTIGYSMGGFGAMVNAMQHPELFSMSAPLSMSFRTDAQYMSESQDGWDNQWGRIFGGRGQAGEARLTDYYKSLCPLHQFTAENKNKYSSVHWFVTCGDDEQQLLIANDDLHVLMRDNGYAHQYRVGNGAHTASYWKTALEEVLPYFSALMAGESAWELSLKQVNVPEGCTFDSEGVFVSEGYQRAETNGGVALYVAFEDIEKDWIQDALSILQRGIGSKKFVLLPCDLNRKTLPEWVNYYKDIYPATHTQVLAVGKTGKAAVKSQSLFSSLYFENAEIPADVSVSKERYYYIGQCDDGPAYPGANALYKACKSQEAPFEYRCRNHLADARLDFLTGIEYVKDNLHDF